MNVGVLEFMDTNASLPPAVLFIYYYKVCLTNGRELNWTEKFCSVKMLKKNVTHPDQMVTASVLIEMNDYKINT